MNLLITGATGFIGRNLITAYKEQGREVRIFATTRHIPQHADESNVNWVAADLSESGWVENLPRDPVDVIVHLAQSNHYRQFPAKSTDIFNINVRATFELAEWALSRNVKHFIFASTGNVYGSKNRVHHENDACDPESMYGASKLSAETLLKPFSQHFAVTILRLFSVYGPGQTDAMLPGVMRRFIQGDEIFLAGSIGVKFNPIYIDDAIKVVDYLSNSQQLKKYSLLNIGGDQVIDLMHVAKQLESISKRPARINITPDDPKYLVGSIEKLKTFFDLSDAVSIEEGVRKTFDAINDQS